MDFSGRPDLDATELEVVVETARVDDARGIRDVQAETWYATYVCPELGITEALLRERLEGANGEKIEERVDRWSWIIENSGTDGETFVARTDGHVIGFGSAQVRADDGLARVAALYVLPEFQGTGLGKALIKRVIDWHGSNTDIYVEVAAYNEPSIGFYESCGFRRTGRDIEDAQAKEAGVVEIPQVELVRPAQG